MPLCILAGGKTMTLAAAAFTLSWTHSVEKTEWRESWVVKDGKLLVVESSVRGSGAGMEPPEGSTFEDGWWVYRPDLPPQQKLLLASSGATAGGWQLCAAGDCVELGREAASGPIDIRACED
ncbi:MAG: DUF1850 domain-containing protein [Rhizobiaceae bacterium]|nr:DUF1850 domain-containing protein [Rhizobiaceae bacterium]